MIQVSFLLEKNVILRFKVEVKVQVPEKKLLKQIKNNIRKITNFFLKVKIKKERSQTIKFEK